MRYVLPCIRPCIELVCMSVSSSNIQLVQSCSSLNSVNHGQHALRFRPGAFQARGAGAYIREKVDLFEKDCVFCHNVQTRISNWNTSKILKRIEWLSSLNCIL